MPSERAGQVEPRADVTAPREDAGPTLTWMEWTEIRSALAQAQGGLEVAGRFETIRREGATELARKCADALDLMESATRRYLDA